MAIFGRPSDLFIERSPQGLCRMENESRCHKKKSYFSKSEAAHIAKIRESEIGFSLSIYKCPCCLQYHLTKSNKSK